MNSVRSEINLRTRAAIAGLDRRIGRDFTGSAIEPKRKRCASNATLDVLLTPRHFYGLRAVGEIKSSVSLCFGGEFGFAGLSLGRTSGALP